MSPARHAVIGVGVTASLALFAGPPRAEGPETPATIWDGVYAEAQAERGSTTYVEECAACHGAVGHGSPHAGPIVGESFEETWSGRPLVAYWAIVRDQMPPGRPGSLSDRRAVAVVARLLQLHGAPAGPSELPADEEALAGILIVPRPDSLAGRGGGPPSSHETRD